MFPLLHVSVLPKNLWRFKIMKNVPHFSIYNNFASKAPEEREGSFRSLVLHKTTTQKNAGEVCGGQLHPEGWVCISLLFT